MQQAALCLASTLRCLHCGHCSDELMPVDACVVFHTCGGCGAMLRPKPGDCCVFCSYGSVPCPPVQQNLCCNAKGTNVGGA